MPKNRWNRLNTLAKVIVLRAGVFVVSMAVLSYLSWFLYSTSKQLEALELENNLQIYAERLHLQIDSAIESAAILRSLVISGDLNEQRFYPLANELSKQIEGVFSLQLAPNGVVEYVYPYDENEKALGHNLLEDELIASIISDSIAKKKIVLDGPKPIIQGGKGLIVRLPIFKDSHFWGFSIALLRFPEMLEPVKLHNLIKQGYQYELFSIDPWGASTSLLDKHQRHEFSKQQTIQLRLSGQQWLLAIKPVNPHVLLKNLGIYLVLSALFSVLLVELVAKRYLLQMHKKNLQRLVDDKTDQLVVREQSLMQAQSVAQIGSWEFSIGSGYRIYSEQAQQILNLESPECFNSEYQALIYSKYQPRFQQILNYRGEGRLSIDYKIHLKTNQIWIREVVEYSAERNKLVGTIQNISKEVKDQELIWQHANVDTLTGLPNANYLHKKMVDLISLKAGTNRSFAVLVVDLDGFKRVNDSLSSKAGDEILIQFSDRLSRCVINEGFIARYSADEFVIVAPDSPEASAAEIIPGLIQKEMQMPFSVTEGTRFMTSSIGISCWPEDSLTALGLIQLAEIALHEIKAKDRGLTARYRPSMLERSQQQAAIEGDLRQAIINNELSMVYQPIVDVNTHTVGSMEALIRWKHPEKGFIPPDQFIPIAESSGIMILLGRWIINQVAIDCQFLKGTELEGVRVAINISRIQFVDDSFSDYLQSCLVEQFPKNQKLTLEVTESTLHNDAEHSVNTVKELLDENIQFALDDFGTGYSSFISLKEFHVDNVKIDRSFISRCDEVKDDETLVKAIIEMAHTMGFSVTAEGVENEAQLMKLQELKCDFIQGYFFSKPLPIEQVIKQGSWYGEKLS